jgi:hypothetical protein
MLLRNFVKIINETSIIVFNVSDDSRSSAFEGSAYQTSGTPKMPKRVSALWHSPKVPTHWSDLNVTSL